MTAPMTLEGAIEEARRRGLGPGWITQDGQRTDGDRWGVSHGWYWSAKKPRRSDVCWVGGCMNVYLGTGSLNPDGWRNTLTQVTEVG